MDDSMTNVASTHRQAKADASATCASAAVTPEKPGTAGTAKCGNGTGRPVIVLNANETAWFVRSSVPVARANFFYPFFTLPSTPIMLNRRQQSTAPAPSSNAPAAGKLFFMLFLVSLRIVALGAQHGLMASNGTLLRQRPKLVRAPAAPALTPLQFATGSCLSPLTVHTSSIPAPKGATFPC